jgi:transcriptional regulator with XRE-family HTH domain
MAEVKAVTDWMVERGLSLAELVEKSGLDRRVVEAIARGQYTPSPQQRQALALVLGVATEHIAWGHQVAVAHVYGHGLPSSAAAPERRP